MSSWRRRIPFRVDVAGIIEIMGSSLYSRADTPIRELIQNAHDAIERRRSRDLNYRGRIDILPNADVGSLAFKDDGVGLTAEEAETFLGTLGIGMTGLIKRGNRSLPEMRAGDDGNLIGQFGIGLFSAFMLADRVVVESRSGERPAVRWEAGGGAADIELASCDYADQGTTVTLFLKPEHRQLAENRELLEAAIKEFADFLPTPIFIDQDSTRTNVINVAWFDSTPDHEAVELALESYFNETPLEVLPLRMETPVYVAGALYFTSQRVSGFSGEAVVTATLRRMVISRNIHGLLPEWASFVRGVLELADCAPTASREDLVRDDNFAKVSLALEEQLFSHLERLDREQPERLQAILAWHHYQLCGAALSVRRLRKLLRGAYRLPTSRGLLTYEEIFQRSEADVLIESDAERVVWYNADRRQERWINALFGAHAAPCVHALRGFEEPLLACFAADDNASGVVTDLRLASPSSRSFARGILGVRDLEDAPPAWREFFAASGAVVLCASFRDDRPVMAFLNERAELLQTLDDLKTNGTIPAGFQRLIDARFGAEPIKLNEVLLNRRHRLVARALDQKTSSPLACVLRLLVHNALVAAGAALPAPAQSLQADDLEWIADALWGKSP